MTNRNHGSLLFFMVLVLFILSGCAGYGKFVFESSLSGSCDSNSRMTIQRLIENRMHYHISYWGLSSHQARGIMFDIKEDDFYLKGDSWKEVKDEGLFSSLVLWRIEPHGQGRLYKIIGPHDKLFGYIFFPEQNESAAAKVIDDKTLYIFGKSNFDMIEYFPSF
ncbi:MAG: hypothetical protein JW882_21935 [Deltaproteobacteria bacterium]|nr:hypothetical protein [Deltaproteobacteria bacterium]